MTERTCIWCGEPVAEREQRAWLTSYYPAPARARSVVDAIGQGFADTMRALTAPAQAQVEYDFHGACWEELDAILHERRQ